MNRREFLRLTLAAGAMACAPVISAKLLEKPNDTALDGSVSWDVGRIIYIDPSAIDSGDGTSWENAYASMAEAEASI